ncbi:uncharacterized protein METZ01_LOCUS263716, partial [marine metagenome]
MSFFVCVCNETRNLRCVDRPVDKRE